MLSTPTNVKSTHFPADKTYVTKTLANPKPWVPTIRRTLTPAELSEKRAKNLYFWCDEQYTPGHKCKGKKPKFFHIEVEDEEECTQEEEASQKEELMVEKQCAQISLEAIEGITNFQTKRVTGHHGKKSLQVLLDTDSTQLY